MILNIEGCLDKFFSDKHLDAYIYIPDSPITKNAWFAFGAFQQDELFGLAYFSKRQIAAVIVKPNNNDWYQNKSITDSLVIGVEKLKQRGYSIACGYGSSMGAFAAIAFSNIYKPLRVLAIAPQVSIFPEIVGHQDRRWGDVAARLNPILPDCRTGFYKNSSLVICYDPLHREDSYNVKLILDEIPGQTIKFPMAGHGLLGTLKSLNILSLCIDVISKLNSNSPSATYEGTSSMLSLFKSKKRNSPDYWFNLAQKLFNKKSLDKAISCCYTSIKFSETHYARKLLSEIWQEKEVPQRSLANLERAIELAPFIGGYMIAYGIKLSEAGNIEKAGYVFKQAIKDFPDLPSAYACLADIYARQDNYIESLACIEYALVLNPSVDDWKKHRIHLTELLNNNITAPTPMGYDPYAVSSEANVYPPCEMYQDYFSGMWRLGVRPMIESATIPFSYLENLSPDVFRAVWQFEPCVNFLPGVLSKAKIEIEFSGNNPNNSVIITPPKHGFVTFEFIAPETDLYSFKFLVTDGQVLLICTDQYQSSWLCNNGLSGDFCLNLEKNTVIAFCMLVLTETATLHTITHRSDLTTLLSPGSNLLIHTPNITSADTFRMAPCSNKFPSYGSNSEVSLLMNPIINGFLKKTIPDIDNRLEKNYSKSLPYKKYLMFFVPRSGSTLLSELISTANVAGFPHEYLTPDIYYALKSLVFGGCGDYIDFIEKRFQSNNGCYGIKIDYDRYINFWNWYLDPNIGKYRTILVDRRDFICQVVSQYYMTELGRGFDTEYNVEISEQFSLNMDHLKRAISFLVRHKIGIRQINENYRNIIYFEDIVTGNFSKKLANALDLSEAEFDKLKLIESSNIKSYFKPSDIQGKKYLKSEILDYVESPDTEYIIYNHCNFVIRSITPIGGLEDTLIDIDQREPGLFWPFIRIEYDYFV